MPPANLFRFITLYNLRGQLLIVGLALLSLPIAYLTLELPKLIIDDAIKGTDFPRRFMGYEFGQIAYLELLCAGFLGLFILSNILKFSSNVLRGVSGERLLRRLRYMLVERFLRLKRGDERHYSTGEVVQIVTAEAQPLGAFVGDAFATPILQGGTLLVYLAFIFAQDAVLGTAAILLFPVQGVLVPLMQRKVVRLTQERIANSRMLSEELAENVSGLDTLRMHDAIRWRLSKLSSRLYSEFRIRFDLFQQKFMIKFVNNVFNQVTPFAFYLLGGYFVIIGELEIGALVAVIAAFKDLASPWRELLNYYQTKVDVAARYAAVLERFGAGAVESEAPAPPPAPAEPPRLEFGPIRLDGHGALSGLSAQEAGAAVCVTGGDERLRSAAIRAMAGLDENGAGAARLDGRDLGEMSFGERACRLAMIGREPFFFRGALRDNLALGVLRPQPAELADAAPQDGTSLARWRRRHESQAEIEAREARATGNFLSAPDAPMIDFAAVGVDGLEAFDARILELAEALDLSGAIFEAGLGATIDPETGPELAAAALAMRAALRDGARDAGRLDDVVEYWAPDRFNANASLAENLLYAAPSGPPLTSEELAAHPDVEPALRRHGVEAMLIAIGAEIVETTAEILDALDGAAPMLREFDLYPPERAASYRAAALQAKKRDGARLTRTQRRMLIGVAFGFTPARHRLSVLTDARRDEIIAARARFADLDATGRFLRFDADRYLPGMTLRGNALLGKLRRDRRDHWSRIGVELWDLAVEHGVAGAIARLGLDVEMTPRNGGYTPDQKMRMAVLRALLARPRLLMLDGPGGSSSAQDRMLLERVRSLKGEAILVYASASPPKDDAETATIDLDKALQS